MLLHISVDDYVNLEFKLADSHIVIIDIWLHDSF